jgi:hypothetical protein
VNGSGGSEGGITQVNDATEPQSPPGLWRWTFNAGEHGDPGNGWGVGNLATGQINGARRLYKSWRIRFTQEWLDNRHTISNKWSNVSAVGCNLLCQLYESGSFFRGEAIEDGVGFNPQINTPPPVGVWLHAELEWNLIPTTGTFKFWLNGVLRNNGSWTHSSATMIDCGNYGHRGGGGECSTCGDPPGSSPPIAVTNWYDVGHFYVAWQT